MANKISDYLKNKLSSKQTYTSADLSNARISDKYNSQTLPVLESNMSDVFKRPSQKPPIQDDMYTRASKATREKYGVHVPPHFLRAVRQQESSGIVDEKNLNLSMGITPTAITSLGESYLQPTSLDNVIQNSSNYLASRARGTLDTGAKFDLSTPENFSKWYVQRYVGVLPGGSRKIGNEMVPYQKIVDSFEKLLTQYQE